MFIDAETRIELKMFTDTGVEGASSVYKGGVEDDTCQEMCTNDSLCTAAVFDSNSKGCFIYHGEAKMKTAAGFNMFKKEEITSAGAFTI